MTVARLWIPIRQHRSPSPTGLASLLLQYEAEALLGAGGKMVIHADFPSNTVPHKTRASDRRKQGLKRKPSLPFRGSSMAILFAITILSGQVLAQSLQKIWHFDDPTDYVYSSDVMNLNKGNNSMIELKKLPRDAFWKTYYEDPRRERGPEFHAIGFDQDRNIVAAGPSLNKGGCSRPGANRRSATRCNAAPRATFFGQLPITPV